MTTRHLLIDGDVVAFRAAASAQEYIEDSFGWVRPLANIAVGEAIVENLLSYLTTGLKGDTFEVVLSDPEANFRHNVDATYKGNRAGTERPLLVDRMKTYLRETHAAYHWPMLEADDVLSIKMTEPPAEGVERVCVGCDKDFKTIPGLHHAIKQDVAPDGRLLVREVSPWEATMFHLRQTLAGDRVDGYSGCPGIGMDRAETILAKPVLLTPSEGVKTRGVNKGDAVVRWMSEPTKDLWACIVSHYSKQGLTEEDALRTARLARLLRHGEYSRVHDEVEIEMWTPGPDIRGAQ